MKFCERRRKEGRFWQERKRRNNQEKDPSTLKVRISQAGKVASSREAEGGKLKEEEEVEKEKEGDVQTEEMVEEVQRDHLKPVYDETEERQQGEGNK